MIDDLPMFEEPQEDRTNMWLEKDRIENELLIGLDLVLSIERGFAKAVAEERQRK